MNSDSKSSLNQQLIKANSEKIKALEESKAQLTEDLRSILDHVLMYNENSTSNPVPVASLTCLASELDVFYNTLTETCTSPDVKEPTLDPEMQACSSPGSRESTLDTELPAFSTSSDEVLAAFDFSKAGVDSNHAYECLPDAPPVKRLDGDLYKLISERPELMSCILVEPANKLLLLDFFKPFLESQKTDQCTVKAELLSWAANLPHVIADSSSGLHSAYLKTRRDLGPEDFTEVDGIRFLTRYLRKFLKTQADRKASSSGTSGTFTAIVNCMLDIDDPLQANGESDPPTPRPTSRQRPVREAFQEQLLESANSSTSSWLHRVAGFDEFPGALAFPPNLGHTSQMARLEIENQTYERDSEENLVTSSGSGPTPMSLTNRLSGLIVSGISPLSGFPVFNSGTGMFSNSDGTRASFTLFAATGSSHKSLYPTFDYRDIGRKIESRANLDILKTKASDSPTVVEDSVQTVPDSPKELAEVKESETKPEKPTVLSAMMQSWEELPPRESAADNQTLEPPAVAVESPESSVTTDEIATTPETSVDLPAVAPTSVKVSFEEDPTSEAAETVTPAPEPLKSASSTSTQTTGKTVKPKNSKGKPDRSRSPSPSRKSPRSKTDLLTVRSKATLSKIKLSRSKTSQVNIKSVATEANAASKHVVFGKTETVTPVLRGKPPIRPKTAKKEKLTDPGVSYREQNKEQVERIQIIQARCSTASILTTPENTKMDPCEKSTNLPSGFKAAQKAQMGIGKDANANEVDALPTVRSSTVRRFLIETKDRLFGTPSRTAKTRNAPLEDVEGEWISDVTPPSNIKMYVPSSEFEIYPPATARPKSPSPSGSHVRIMSRHESPVHSRPVSRTSSRSNTAENVLTKKPSAKVLSYAEIRKRRLEIETQKAGIVTNRLGFPVPPTKPKSQIPTLKIAPKTVKESRIPASPRPVTQGAPRASGTAKPSQIQAPRRISKSRG